MAGEDRALGLEQKEHVLVRVVHRFEIALALGDDQIGLLVPPAKGLRAGFQNRAGRVGAVVDHLDQVRQELIEDLAELGELSATMRALVPAVLARLEI